MNNVNPDAIPDELAERDQWLLWDANADTPRRPHWRGDFGISWSDPDEWRTFQDAVQAASESDTWGIGYVMALDNDDHPRGLYGCIDIDGGQTDDGALKDWVPDLDRFTDALTYIEQSPSGTGLHIPFVGHDVPDWWRDSHLDDHEGVDVLTNKFCTFTGDTHPDSGSTVAEIDPTPWLYDAYETINGEAPRLEPEDDHQGDYDDDYLDADTLRDALDAIPPDVEYPTWRNIGFALHSHYDGGREGRQLFEEWSRGGQKWDDRAERYVDAIWENATTSGGIGIGTLVYHAKDHGWQHPTPETPPDGGNEPVPEPDDDWSLDETIQRLVLDALNPDSDRDPITQDKAVDRAASILCQHYDFLRPRDDTRGWRDTLYVYSDSDGIYEPHGETFLQTEAERLLGDFATNQRVREIVGKIERRSRVNERRLDTPPERLVVANGILNLTTGELDDHTPDEYHQTMIDIEYHPDAECPRIDGFLHDVVEPHDVPTLYRLIAHTLYKEYAAEKAAMLLGDGQNGKSVFLSLVEQFLGEWNVSNQSLQELNDDQWAPANLVGKLANVHPDLSDSSVDTMQMFKKLTGRDTVSADVKFEEPVRFENHATLIFACNRMPVLQDDTRGNWRRWLLIDFPNTFEREDDNWQEKSELMNELTQSEQLQGLLARCVDEIREWDQGRAWFPNAPSWEQSRKRIRRAAEPVYDFAHACLREQDEDHVPADTLRQAYRAYASEEGLPPMGPEQFGQKILNVADFTIEKGQIRKDSRRMAVYKNVKLSSRGRELLGDTPDVDEGQDHFNGPPGRADRVFELLRDEYEDNGHETVHREYLIGMATAEGMTREQAERAVDQILTDGRAIKQANNQIAPGI